MPELVTIVIPVFNQPELTRACLASLRARVAGAPFEILIVDNASEAETKTVLAESARDPVIRVLANDANLGFARACNQGARVARGDLIVFLNSDTEVEADWLGPLARSLRQDVAVGAVGGMLLNMDGTIQSAGMYLVDCRQTLVPYLTWMAGAGARVEEFAAFNYPRICPMVSGACLATRRVTFLEMGGFDEGYYNGYEDADYCLRLGERGLLVVYQPGSVVRHHGSPNPPERFRCHRENRARFLARWQALVPAHAIRTADGQMRFTSGDHPRRYLGLGT